MVLRAGIEPARPQGTQDFLTNYDFRRLLFEKVICGLDYTFAFYYKIAVRQESSSLYTFIEIL